MDHGVQIERIRRKLGRARGVVRAVRSLVTGERSINLGPPLGEREVSAFEQAHGISLPACYRSFLTQVGQGGGVTGAGIISAPFGLLPLGDDLLSGSGRTMRRLSRPPIITPELTDEAWDELARRHAEISETQDDDEQEEADVWLYAGLLDVASAGCAGVWCLVLSGPCCGRVVHANMDECKPVFEPDANFLAWYERLLDSVIQGDASAMR